jgi:hypothetical protein
VRRHRTLPSDPLLPVLQEAVEPGDQDRPSPPLLKFPPNLGCFLIREHEQDVNRGMGLEGSSQVPRMPFSLLSVPGEQRGGPAGTEARLGSLHHPLVREPCRWGALSPDVRLNR